MSLASVVALLERDGNLDRLELDELSDGFVSCETGRTDGALRNSVLGCLLYTSIPKSLVRAESRNSPAGPAVWNPARARITPSPI